jgi:hypothetical protein
MDDHDCRVCGKTLALDYDCEWPEEGPICFGCLSDERDALLAQLAEARDAIVAGQQREYAIVNAMVRQTFTGKWHELAGGVITPRREEAVGLFYRRAGIDPPPCPCPPGEGDCRAVSRGCREHGAGGNPS